jgi:uncharacterized membrane protein YphA (DoxX/SURF4 family)
MTDGMIARLALGIIFIYHGLVPKILFLSETEIQMIQAHGPHFPVETTALGAGLAEIALGIALLFLRNAAWPVVVAITTLIILLIDTALFSPQLLIEAFNPVSTNVAAIALCIIALRACSRTLSDGETSREPLIKA